MSLRDAFAAGLDLTDLSKVDAAMLTPVAAEAAAAPDEFVDRHETAVTPQDIYAEPEPVAANAAPAPAEAADENAPPLTVEEQLAAAAKAAEDPAAKIAALEAKIAELTKQQEAAAAAQTEVAEKSAAVQEQEALVKQLAEEWGEDHPAVKLEKLRLKQLEASEAKAAANTQTTEEAANAAAHATHVAKTPFLKSLYEANDADRIAVATALSMRIMDDPKLADHEASKPFTAAHYREVEARLLKMFPEAKAQFYGVKKPNVPRTPTGVDAVRGGTSPSVGGAKANTTDPRMDLFQAALANPNTPLDQLMSGAMH